jgi:CheY-like chemotaxis protein
VVSATDPHEALTIVAERSFDIVVTDVDMPGAMNGAQFAEELRRLQPDLPVLLMSGAALATGTSDADLPFIAKPFRKNALVQKLQSLIVKRNDNG